MLSIVLLKTTNQLKIKHAKYAPSDATTKGTTCLYRSFVRTGPERPTNQYATGFTIITRANEYDAATPTGPHGKPTRIEAIEIGAFIIDHCNISRERPWLRNNHPIVFNIGCNKAAIPRKKTILAAAVHCEPRMISTTASADTINNVIAGIVNNITFSSIRR